MATRDWSALDWTPNLTFALPTERQLAQSSIADAGKGAEWKFDPTAQNAALLQALGYGGQAFTGVPGTEENPAGGQVWSDDARNWLLNHGYTVGVAHDPGTSAGGRPEYYGLTDANGKFVAGQSDPTKIMSDTLMDQITPFALMAPAFLGAAGVLGAGAEAGVGAGLSAPESVSALGSAWSPEALGLTSVGSAGSDAAASLLSDLSGWAAPGAVDAGTAGAGSLGSNLVARGAPSFLDALQSGALKGAATGGIRGLVTGQNPFQAALKGAVTGAIGGGIGTIGQGSLGNVFNSLAPDSGSSLIPNAFDEAAGASTSTGDFLKNLGSLSDPVSTGGGMDWTQYLPSIDPMTGMPFQTGMDYGSLTKAPWYGEMSLGGNGMFDVGGDGVVPAAQLPDIPEPSSPLDMTRIDEILGRELPNVADVPSMTGGVGTSWLDALTSGLKGVFSPVPDGKGGTKANPIGLGLGALLGAGLGAASGGKTETSSRDPWSAAQPYLQHLLGDADQMRAQLAANPYTPQQTQQYQNAYAGLDQARAALPGLLNWGQGAMQRQSTTPSYAQLFGGGLLNPTQPTAPTGGIGGLLGRVPQPTAPLPAMQAGGPGGLQGNTPEQRIKSLMARGGGLLG